ncbi:hypothetical protein [Streptomyces sp. NPDC058373]
MELGWAFCGAVIGEVTVAAEGVEADGSEIVRRFLTAGLESTGWVRSA